LNTVKLLSLSVLSASVATFFTACAPANIQAQIRNSDVNSNMMTRCEEVDMRSNAEMDKLFKKYDGWRMVYISEYTTDHKIGTSASVCFEKPKN